MAVLSVRPGSRRSSGGYSLANHRLYSCIPTRGKGALGPLLSAPAGASKRETPTSNHTESTDMVVHRDSVFLLDDLLCSCDLNLSGNL